MDRRPVLLAFWRKQRTYQSLLDGDKRFMSTGELTISRVHNRAAGFARHLALPDTEHLRSAGRADTLGSRTTVLHFDGFGIPDLFLRPALHTVSLHLCRPPCRLKRRIAEDSAAVNAKKRLPPNPGCGTGWRERWSICHPITRGRGIRSIQRTRRRISYHVIRRKRSIDPKGDSPSAGLSW